MPGPAVDAASFKNLIVRGNRFVNLSPDPLGLKMRGAIRAELGTGLWVEANEWTSTKDIAPPGLFYDADTTFGTIWKDNHLQVDAK
jgi:hypothetical protein